MVFQIPPFRGKVKIAIQPVASAKAFNEKKSDVLEPDWLIAAGAYPGFFSMKRLGVFLLPLDGMVVHRRSLTVNS